MLFLCTHSRGSFCGSNLPLAIALLYIIDRMLCSIVVSMEITTNVHEQRYTMPVLQTSSLTVRVSSSLSIAFADAWLLASFLSSLILPNPLIPGSLWCQTQKMHKTIFSFSGRFLWMKRVLWDTVFVIIKRTSFATELQSVCGVPTINIHS